MMKKKVGRRDLEKERQWRQHLAEWKRGKLPVAEYCRNAGIKVTTFYGWIKVIRRRDKETGAKEIEPPVADKVSQFVAVRINDPGATSKTAKSKHSDICNVEICLSGGAAIRIGSMSVETFTSIIAEIRGGTC
jgi:hypothetical protein